MCLKIRKKTISIKLLFPFCMLYIIRLFITNEYFLNQAQTDLMDYLRAGEGQQNENGAVVSLKFFHSVHCRL